MGLLDGRVVVVSGIGPGLGAAIALRSARAGAAAGGGVDGESAGAPFVAVFPSAKNARQVGSTDPGSDL